ncbi:Ig-like domain-containing protein [Velocimicrobium porci]|uniref:BIG2 domain-containing protein n=1 Tax=Velocimicrobium porci TaxID=2606634 RepID=A0A6L5XZM1_9FIRM|nr:Ig-like domain-containing protein [Velocimicrobium porci]MSS64182.1 hypothetical protein [Velocimicrobium porci]
MKSNVKKVLTILLILSILPFQQVLNVQAKGVPKLNRTSLYLSTADTYKLKVLNTTKKVKWSSSNKSIVRVESKGMVYPVWTGKATVTAKVDGKTLKCTVNVLDQDIWFNSNQTEKSEALNNYQVCIMPRTEAKVRIKVETWIKNKFYSSGAMYGEKIGSTITISNSGKYHISGTIKIVYKNGYEHHCVVNITNSDLKVLKIKNFKLGEKTECS